MTSAAAAVGAFGGPAAAQQTTAVAHARQVRFAISPQPLASALTLFGRQAGMQVSVDAGLVRGLRSPGASGAMSAQDALERLLVGTGIGYRLTGDNTAMLEKLPQSAEAAPGVIQLEPIRVQGQAANDAASAAVGTASGGYVANESAAATKTAASIRETPQSISVVTRQQLNDQQPQSLNEALRYSPGVLAEPLGVAPTNCGQVCSNNLLVRGFPGEVYIDGSRATTAGDGTSGIDPYLLNRVDVLSGPASVLYGQASPGGVINMSSKLPTETPLHELQFGGGSYGRYGGAFDLGGPIDKDGQFSYRLTGVGFSEGSQVDHIKNQEIAIAPALTWKPDADTSLTLLGKYVNDPNVGGYAFVPASGTVLPNPNGKIPTSFFSGDPNYNTYKQTLGSVGYLFSHRFDDTWSVQQNFRYEHENVDRAVLIANGLASDQRTLMRVAMPDDMTSDTVMVDTRLTGKFLTGFGEHQITLGVDYRNVSADHTNYGGTILAPSINVFAPVYGVVLPNITSRQLNPSNQTQDQTGLYAQDQIAVDHWRFLVGLREDWTDGDTRTTTGATGVTAHTSDAQDELTWRAGLVYLFDNGIAPYFSYSTSFQPQMGTTFDGQPFVPTTGEQYEAGIKYQRPGSNSFVSAAAYDLTQQNVSERDPLHAGFSVQVGEVHVQGVELQAHASLTRDLSLTASYTYMDAVNKNPAAIGGQPVEQATAGLPRNMASIWSDYTFHDGPLRGLGLGAGARYTGSSYASLASASSPFSGGQFKVPDFTLFDAALHYDLGEANPALKGFKLQVNVTNLFDKSYVSSCASTIICYYGLRRTVYATVKYDW